MAGHLDCLLDDAGQGTRQLHRQACQQDRKVLRAGCAGKACRRPEAVRSMWQDSCLGSAVRALAKLSLQALSGACTGQCIRHASLQFTTDLSGIGCQGSLPRNPWSLHGYDGAICFIGPATMFATYSSCSTRRARPARSLWRMLKAIGRAFPVTGRRGILLAISSHCACNVTVTLCKVPTGHLAH